MARLNLTPNVPAVLAIMRAGESVPSNFTRGGFDVLFKTDGGDQLYMEPEKAGDIEREMQQLGIRYGEQMQLTKIKQSHGRHAYRVERLRDSGGHNVPERSAGYNAPPAPPPPPPPPAHAPRYSEAAALPPLPSNPVTPASAKFLAAYMVAIDTLIESRVYAQRKGLALEIHCEDVRALAATLIIDAQKGGR